MAALSAGPGPSALGFGAAPSPGFARPFTCLTGTLFLLPSPFPQPFLLSSSTLPPQPQTGSECERWIMWGQVRPVRYQETDS